MTVEWPADKVERRPIDALIPYARNARTHSEEQVAQIAASIREWGWTVPVLVDETGGIIAGHGRVMAARKLGLPEVPVMVAAGWSEAQRRAYVLADNKLALNAGWDTAMLAEELKGLADLGFDAALTGFSADELAALTVEQTEGLTDPDEVPEPPADPVSVLGDVWLLGKHKIVCGDCTDANVAKTIGAESCDLLLSDPPYGLGYEYAEHDDSDNAKNAQLVADAFSLGPAPKAWSPGLNNLARDISRFGKARIIVWAKGFAAAGNGLGGASTWEPILTVGRTPERKLRNDVLEIKTERLTVNGKNLRELHSCPKPVALYEALAEALSAPAQIIYEPFSGSGTTIIACEKTGRICRAVEITPAYVDVAVKRWQEFTGQQATLENDGRTYAELEAERIGKKAA
jgi:DNA modification methylase